KLCTAKTLFHYPVSKAGIWVDCITKKAPAIHNDYPHYPNKKGIPKGHFPLENHMSAPVLQEEKVKAVVGVGNKTGNYSKDDAELLHTFINETWTYIELKKKQININNFFMHSLSAFALHEIILDEEGKPIDYYFIDANPSFEKITGLKLKEILGKRALEVIPDLEKSWIKKYGKVAITQEPIFFEQYSSHLKKYFTVTAFSPEKGYFVVSFEDSTKRKQLEKELQAMYFSSVAANRVKSNFLFMLNHELNSPLNTIIGFSKILADKEFSKEVKEYATIINNKAQTLAGSISNILKLSDNDEDADHLEKKSVNLKKLLQQIIYQFKLKVSEKHLIITSSLELHGDLRIHSDAAKIGQILKELIDNAIKFTEKGKISITAKSENLPDTDQVKITIKIQDTGCGIEPKDIQNIFDPFYQLEDFINRKHSGLGIGLSICQRLASLLKGKISVESKSGEGSIFIFTFIAETIQRKNTIEKTIISDYSFLNQKKILIVDDDPLNQLLVEHILKNHSVICDKAINGIEAVEKAIKNSYDLILMDIQMPEKNGIEATRDLRLEHKLQIPIIAITAHSTTGYRDICIKAGMNDYLEKPIHDSDLIQAMYNVL
ncbi:MAG: response regulator, partial [Leptospiraceae bacterium]|nr:response regulator [Leptospiraceae bacterium]